MAVKCKKLQILPFQLKFLKTDVVPYKKTAAFIFSAFNVQMEYVLGIDSKKVKIQTQGIKMYTAFFYNDQFLRVQRHRLIRNNYMNL